MELKKNFGYNLYSVSLPSLKNWSLLHRGIFFYFLESTFNNKTIVKLLNGDKHISIIHAGKWAKPMIFTWQQKNQ